MTQRAASESVRDIEPDRLRADIEDVLERGSMTPGALTLRCARAIDADVDLEHIGDRAAGVQLIYDGLRLTRELAHDQPWASSDDHTDPNVEVLVCNVLVSRGFYLLARTAAAGKAVRTVRSFGHDQTLRHLTAGDDPEEAARLDGTLERHVLELGIVAGADAVGGTPSRDLLATAREVARAGGVPLADSEELLPAVADLRSGTTAGEPAATDDHVQPSATDP